jgi:hypothetical protein
MSKLNEKDVDFREMINILEQNDTNSESNNVRTLSNVKNLYHGILLADSKKMNYQNSYEMQRLFVKQALINALSVSGALTVHNYNYLADELCLDVRKLNKESLLIEKNKIESPDACGDNVFNEMYRYIEDMGTEITKRIQAMDEEYLLIIDECCSPEIDLFSHDNYNKIEARFNSVTMLYLISKNNIRTKEEVYDAWRIKYDEDKTLTYENALRDINKVLGRNINELVDLHILERYTQELYNEIKN